MTTKTDAVTFTIESPAGEEDEVTLPSELLTMLAEEGESGPVVIGDLAMFACAQRVHALLHHSEGDLEDQDQLEAMEDRTMELFEERFGMTFGEATGHQH